MEKNDFNKKLGAFIRKIRTEKSITQQELADKMNLDFQYISRIERGLISPTLFWLVNLIEALDCSEVDFFDNFKRYRNLKSD
jgi:transcriptional regulator with XRE-family HTH domain